jgi:dihydroorotate dehydrogenase (fumarate)
MNLQTTYLGMKLSNPFMPGASPMVDDLDTVRRLEDAGASAIVMHSLFEEQISGQHFASINRMEMFTGGYDDAVDRSPKANEFRLGKDEYLEHIRKLKEKLAIPVIASLNGTTSGGWIQYARHIQQAGADALELNLYVVAADPTESGVVLEQRVMEIVRSIRRMIRIPIAVKLSPYFSSLGNFAHGLVDAGANGLILFNRYYQPDINLKTRQFIGAQMVSDNTELPLRLRWLGILSRQLNASFAISGGVHTADDAIKSILAGANVVQMVSSLMLHGPHHLATVINGVKAWMEKNQFSSLRFVRGQADISRTPDMQAFERSQYVRMLQAEQV